MAHLVRIGLAGLLVAFALVLLPGQAGAAQCKGGDASPAKLGDKRAAKAVLCLINKQRSRHHLKPLRRQHEQAKAARGHNDLMVRRRCFSHECPGEPDLVGRLTKTGYLPCGCSWGVGENIAWGAGRKGSPRRIVNAWMHSPPHRANILRGSFQHAGVGVRWGSPTKRGSNAGTYTLDFGYRR